MKRRSLFLAIAVAAIIGGVGTLDARAGWVPLPTTMDQLLPAGSFTTVAGSTETDTFSNFTFTSSAIPATTPVLDPAELNVSAFGVGKPEAGLEFSGALFAPAGTIVDYKISYIVTAPTGSLLNDALLGATYNIPTGSTGSVVIGESLFNAATQSPIGSLSLTNPAIGQSINFAGVTSILVKKDILIQGGSTGAGLSIVDQGFSSTGVPEPASIALLGIGMTGFLAFRRLFKKTSVA
jgi:hypothetical protein